MAVSKTLFKAFVAGLIFTAGTVFGADLTQENEFHSELFEAVWIDGEGFYAEPVDVYGQRITGEGVFIENVELVPIEVNEGDIVSVSWTENQAEYSDWATPAKIEKEELK
jgi:hypothetical protein